MNGVRDMVRKDDDCKQNSMNYRYDLTTDYDEGRKAGTLREPESVNPYIRGKRPFEYICFYRGWLAGFYDTP